MSQIENIKVVVRVRPFNDREKASNSLRIIDMEGETTIIVNPQTQEPRKFNFDHSYWSHDGFAINAEGYSEPSNPKYVDQKKIFHDLGEDMLRNAWEGYNCTIFAYGQTGSGKSYSIMGYLGNKGLVPKLCEELFKQIDNKSTSSSSDKTYQVQFSMLEIYNEHVRDLLAKKGGPRQQQPEGLRIRQSATGGFYVQDLSCVPVGSYRDIELRIDEGNRNKTIAATNMNDRSSRAHTIVTLKFAQVNMQAKTTTTAIINLVDLAGSERANQTGATGQRLEESKKINQSLSELGNIIKGLCDKSAGKSAQLNFRNSKLTMLLKNALGGNSKTIMIAALSPAAENFDQTLSTLRYADRAKSIKTQAKVNESETEKLIRELITEKEKLLAELQSAKSGYVGEDLERMKKQQAEEIEQYEEQLHDQRKIQKEWANKLKSATEEIQKLVEAENKDEREKKKTPYFWNLNEDPSLCGKIVHFIKVGKHRIGNRKAKPRPHLVLHGPSIALEHAVVENRKSVVTLTAEKGAKLLVNGEERTDEVQLKHNDRVLFGNTNLFVFHHPKEQERLTKQNQILQSITWEFAQDEILKHAKADFDQDDHDALLKEHMLELIPLVDDANEMAKIFKKNLQFKIVLVPPVLRGKSTGQLEICISVYNLDNENEYLWDRNTFVDKRCEMLSLYEEYEGREFEELPNIDKRDDPFCDKADAETLVGVVSVPLVTLAFGESFTDNMLIRNYNGECVGHLNVYLGPCDASGYDKKQADNDEIYEPDDLVGKDMSFKIKLNEASDIPARFTKTWCTYKLYHNPDSVLTKKVNGNNPKYDHTEVFSFKGEEATHGFVLEYLKNAFLLVEVKGYQSNTGNVPRKTSVSRLRENKSKIDMNQEDLDVFLQQALRSGALDEIATIVLNGELNESDKIAEMKRVMYSNGIMEVGPPTSKLCTIQ